ncbi:MAG TPA: hypothetical protein VF493_09695 [Terriglobales bacterium]
MKHFGLIYKFILLFALTLLPHTMCAKTWVWSEQLVDAQPGKFTSIAIDQQGDIHLIYSSDAGAFQYGFRPAGETKWYIMPLENGTGFPNIKLDASGNAHACLAINSSGVIKYGEWDGHRWKFQQIAPGTGPVWFSCSVAVSPNGTPHVTWYQERGPDSVIYGHYKYAELNDGVWLVKTGDFAPLAGKWHSMVVDKQGKTHISYDSFANGELRYAIKDGSNWNIRIADSRHASSIEESLGMGSSLVLDSKGLARISYQTDTLLKYAEEQPDGFFKSRVVDSLRNPWGSWVGYRTTLLLDKDQLPHIIYEDSGNLKHAYWNGEKWTVRILVRASMDPYRYSAAAIDGNDRIYITYRDSQDSSIKLLIGQPDEKGAPEKTPIVAGTDLSTNSGNKKPN